MYQKGWMKDAASGKCIDCKKGTYSETADSASCTPCPEGQTTPRDRSKYASECYGKYIFS